MARSGGFKYSPTISRTFSTNWGSLETLKFSTRCGCRPKARQIRTMAFCDRPVSSAIRRVLQCVLLAGIDSNVFVMTSSILLIGDFARCTDSRLIQQAIQPKLSKPFPPLTDGRAGDVQLPGGLRVAHPFPTTEHDPGTHRHGLRRLRPPRQHAQFRAILSADFQWFLGATCTHTQVCSPPILMQCISRSGH